MSKGVLAELRKAVDINDRFSIINKYISDNVNSKYFKFFKDTEKKLYQQLSQKYLSETAIKKLKSELEYNTSELLDETTKRIKNITDFYVDAQGVESLKTHNNIVNYIKNDYLQDMNGLLFSVKDDFSRAVNHISFVMNNQARSDFTQLYEGMKTWENKDIVSNYKDFIDVFKSDYGQTYMGELMQNPTLKNMLTISEDGIFFNHKNGRKYDVEKYVNNRAKWSTMEVIRKTEEARSVEKGQGVFEFVRIQQVEEERPHSVHDDNHVNNLFSNNPSLIGKVINGREVFKGGTIVDYPLGATAPYGCGHCYVGIDYKESEIKDDNKPMIENKVYESINESLIERIQKE
ncbi:MAG: hypothetical protein KA885_09740 [Spirochaetes bacterium]|nr:hypothetical protein [Spirochaetota bacterium]